MDGAFDPPKKLVSKGETLGIRVFFEPLDHAATQKKKTSEGGWVFGDVLSIGKPASG